MKTVLWGSNVRNNFNLRPEEALLKVTSVLLLGNGKKYMD